MLFRSFADVGAQLGGGVDDDKASFKLRTLSSARERDKALDLYIKILQKPDFPGDVLAREKARVIAGLKEAATQPETIADKAYTKALFGSHPYGFDAEPENIEKIDRYDVQKFYSTHYGAQGAVIALIGDMSREQAEQFAEKISLDLPRADKPAPLAAVSYPVAASEQRISHPATQAHILMGYPGMKRGDPDFFPLYVGNYILGGGGFVSRLVKEVREKRGLAYSVYSYVSPGRQVGPYVAGMQTQKSQADLAVDVMKKTISEFVDHGPTDEEMIAAKNNLINGFPLRIDSNRKILENVASIAWNDLPLDTLDTWRDQLKAVTKEQVNAALKAHLDMNRMVTVVVGAP